MPKTKTNHAPRTTHHKPRSRTQLLPLPGTIARMISLRHHAALTALRQGYGTVDHFQIMLFSVYVTYLMECEHTRAKPEPQPFRAAEAALRQCMRRTEAGEGWTLARDEAEALARLLVMHDAQLWSYPSSHHAKAWERIGQSAGVHRSPLSDGHVLARGERDVFGLTLVMAR